MQTKPKQERLAEASLARVPGLEAYCPFLRIQRVLPRGKVWFKEALFPCYIFAHFDPALHFRSVSYANGVTRVLQFGKNLATVPESMICEIRQEMGGESVREVVVRPHVGDEGELAHGPLRGLSGVIETVNTGAERARILVEILGGVHTVDIDLGTLKTLRDAREFVSAVPA